MDGICRLIHLVAAAVLACVFLTVDTVFPGTLYVLVFIELRSRIVVWSACSAHPNSACSTTAPDSNRPTFRAAQLAAVRSWIELDGLSVLCPHANLKSSIIAGG